MPRSRPTRIDAPLGGALLLAAVIAGCGTTITPTASPPAVATAAVTAAGVLQLPTTFADPVPPGRYSSAPPFGLAFTFQIGDPGWVVGHSGASDFDVDRFDGVPTTALPSRSVGFALPTTVGAAGVSVAVLTPEDAITELGHVPGIVASPLTQLTLFGVASAARADLHASTDNLALFTIPGDTFHLGSGRDVRIVAVAIDGGILLVLVSAAADQLDAAWTQAQPILASVHSPALGLP